MSVLDLQSLEPYARELVDKIEQNKASDPEEMIEVTDCLIDYAKKQEMTDLYAYALFSKGFCLYNLNKTSHAFFAFDQAVEPLLKTEQYELVARSFCCLGIISSSQGNIPVAMDYYLRGMELCEKHDIISVYVMTNTNIGILYQSFHDYQNADRYFQNCIDRVESVRQHQGDYEPTFSYSTVSTLYFNKASILLSMGELKKASDNLKKSADLERKAEDDALRLAIKMLWAQILSAIGRQDEMKQCVREIGESSESIGSIVDAFDDIVSYARFLQSVGMDEEFFHILSKVEEAVKATKSTFLDRKIVQLKVEYYKKNQKHKEYMMEAGLYFELSMKMEEEMEKSYRESLATRMNLENEKRFGEKLKSEAANLKIKSEFDALTGLRNRYKITEISESSYSECLKNQRSLAVEILDVDYFKQFNDNYGHQEGDNVLIKVAAAIRALERHRGVYSGRYGGDEFIIIYVDRTYDEVTEFARELKDSIEKMKIVHEFSLISDRITLSQGLHFGVPSEKRRFWDFLHAADQALYDVKKAGRNDFRISADNISTQ